MCELWRPLRHYSGHRNSYMFDLGICVDEKNRLLACAGDDCRIRVWSLDDDAPCAEIGSQGTDKSRGHHSGAAGDALPSPATALAWIPSDCTPALPALAAASAQQVRVYTGACARMRVE